MWSNAPKEIISFIFQGEKCKYIPKSGKTHQKSPSEKPYISLGNSPYTNSQKDFFVMYNENPLISPNKITI